MEQADVKFHVGEHLQLQPRDGEDGRRLHVKLIGFMPGASLLVTTPTVGGKTMIMREGQPFVARMMAGKRIVGFATTVLRSCARPFPYLHLAFPAEIEQITVRKSHRVRIKLFASVKNDNPEFQFEKPRSATVIDISTTGALLIAATQLAAVDDAIEVQCALRIGGSEKLLSLPAVVRNVHTENSDEHGADSFYHGLEFKLKTEQQILALHAFVYEQIVRQQSD